MHRRNSGHWRRSSIAGRFRARCFSPRCTAHDTRPLRCSRGRRPVLTLRRHHRHRRGRRWPRLRRGTRELCASDLTTLIALDPIISPGANRNKKGNRPLLPRLPAAPTSLTPDAWRNMAWFSILPDHLSSFETWIARLFVGLPGSPLSPLHQPAEHCSQIFFGVVTIGPWAVLIIYDLVLYCSRTVAYELPVFGGRATGKRSPRAPSLTDGQRRQLSPMMHAGDEADARASGTSRAADSDASIQSRRTAKEDS